MSLDDETEDDLIKARALLDKFEERRPLSGPELISALMILKRLVYYVSRHNPGATGVPPIENGPEGDLGELRAVLDFDIPRKLLRLNFGKEIQWLTMKSNEARVFSAALNMKAAQLDDLVRHLS